MKAAIVGVGLIGGSFAPTLKDNGICDEVIGVDNSERNRAKALELGLVDRTASLAEAVAGADLVVLATPVDSIPLLAVKVLNQVDRQVVIDMGSTKQELCEVIAQHPRRGRFVATHPMHSLCLFQEVLQSPGRFLWPRKEFCHKLPLQSCEKEHFWIHRSACQSRKGIPTRTFS